MTIIQAHKYYYMRRGAERYLLELSDWLRSQGHEVIPFAMRHPENLPTPYARYFPRRVHTMKPHIGLGALRTLGRMFYSLSARRGMASVIAETGPDICHVHNIYTHLSPSILDALADQGVPVVMSVHDHHLISPSYGLWADGCGPDVSDYGIVRGTLSRFHKRSYLASFAQTAAYKFHRGLGMYKKHILRYFVPSAYLKEKLVQGGFPSERIRVNPYGIDPDVVEPRYDSDGHFLFVGSLSVEKGADMAIRLARLIPDIRVRIVGRGPQEAYLHRLGHGHENVEFVGFRSGEDLWEEYRNAAALLMPSRMNETFGLSALEAMAAGTPVIASRAGGLPEVVEDRTTGFLVDPTDLHGWAEAVMRFSLDEGLRRRMAMNARLAASERFHIRGHHERLMRDYEAAIRENLSD